MKLLEEKRVDFYMESPYPTYLINRLGSAGYCSGVGKAELASIAASFSPTKKAMSRASKICAAKSSHLKIRDRPPGISCPSSFCSRKDFPWWKNRVSGAKVSAREIGYIFADTDKNMVNLVLQNKAAGGAFSNDDYASVNDANKASLSILGESESLPRHLVSVRKDLPEPLVNRLKEILLSMHQDEDGQKILQQTDGTTKFDSLPGGAESVRRKLVELYRLPRQKLSIPLGSP